MRSTIDHFLISPNVKDSIISVNTVSLANNFSDHIPIKLTLKAEIELHDTINRFTPMLHGINVVIQTLMIIEMS